MLLRHKPLLSKNLIFLAALYVSLNKTVFAQIASHVAQSHILSDHHNFATWHGAALIFGTVFGASIFWWRREKSQEEAAERRFPGSKGKAKDKAERKTRPQSANGDGDKNNGEVNADVANWIQNNIGSNSAQGASRKPSNASDGLAKSALVFKLPDAPIPIIPLPVLKDQLLIESIEQIQHFNATEEERETAINVLIAFKSHNAVEALTQVAHYDESARLRIAALNGLGEFNHDSVFEPILLTCADPAREVRAAAARTFARLNVNRAEAYTRIVESADPERLRLSSMVCIDSGLAKHSLPRLAHHDAQQANDAFAMVRLLVAAGQFAPISEVISSTQDVRASLIMLKALHVIRPTKMMPILYHLSTNNEINHEVKRALNELIAELNVSQ